MYKCGVSVVSGNRKDWKPAEEATFLNIWYSNLVALRDGKTRRDFHKDLVAEFVDQGIDVPSSKIQRKMQTFKRRYYNVKDNKKARKEWINFDRMVAIMKYEEAINKTSSESQMEDSSSAGYVEESAGLLLYPEESSQPEDDIRATSSDGALPKKSQRIRNRTEINTAESNMIQKIRQRRTWSQQDEDNFIDIWETNIQNLRSQEKKREAYEKMESELRSRGIEITITNIKSKIDTFARKFRNVSSVTTWINYAKVGELLGILEASDQLSESRDYIHANILLENTEDVQNKTRSTTIYPETCLKIELNEEDQPPAKKIKTDNTLGNTEDVHNETNDVIELSDPEDFEFEMLQDDSMDVSSIRNSDRGTGKIQLSDQFGQFVVKELNLLNDDLLIEAKRRIYNIICRMHMKQLRLGQKTS